MRSIGPRFAGPYVQLSYGAIILSFMSGVLWGFATRPGPRGGGGLCAVGDSGALGFLHGRRRAGLGGHDLIAGFVGLLVLDWHVLALGARAGMVDEAARAPDDRCVVISPCVGDVHLTRSVLRGRLRLLVRQKHLPRLGSP